MKDEIKLTADEWADIECYLFLEHESPHSKVLVVQEPDGSRWISVESVLELAEAE